MSELQLVIQDEALLKEVTFNYEQLKTDLTKSLEKYTSLVVEESAIKDAKVDRANLNKLDKALKDKGKEIKQKLLGGFDVKLSELCGLVSSASLGIDKQVKSFEQKVKDDKRAEIKVIYDNNIGDLEILLPFEKVFNEKMLNTTATMAKIVEEITARISTVSKDLQVIDTLNVDADIMVPVKDYYLQTLNLSAALTEKTRLEARKASIAAIAQSKPIAVPTINSAPIELERSPQHKRRVEFFVVATNEQLLKIREFLVQNQIEFGGINNAK